MPRTNSYVVTPGDDTTRRHGSPAVEKGLTLSWYALMGFEGGAEEANMGAGFVTRCPLAGVLIVRILLTLSCRGSYTHRVAKSPPGARAYYRGFNNY